MAEMGSGFMGDATSGIGQGAAFVLPEGKSAQYAMQLAQTHGQQLQEMARQRAAMQQKQMSEYHKDFMQTKLPEMAKPLYSIIGKRFDDWTAKGAGVLQKTGRNPFDDPQHIAEYNEQILIPARKSQELFTEYSKQRALADKDKDNMYTQESKDKIMQWEKDFNKDPLSMLDKDIPQLEVRSPTMNEFVDTLKTVKTKNDNGDWETVGPSRKDHEQQAYTNLLGDNKWNALLTKYGYHPDMPDFSAYQYEHDKNGHPIKSTGQRAFPTTQEYADYTAKQWLADPNREAQIAKAGINKDDPFAEQKLAHMIIDQNTAMGKAVKVAADALDSKTEKAHTRTDKATKMEMAAERIDIARERFEQAKNKAGGKEAWINSITQAFLHPAEHADVHPQQAIEDAFKSAPGYNGQVPKFHTDATGRITSITIPPYALPNPKYDKAVIDGIKNPASKQAMIDLNPPFLEKRQEQTIPVDMSNEYSFATTMSRIAKLAVAPGIDKIHINHGSKPAASEKPAKSDNKQYTIDGKKVSMADLRKVYTEEQIQRALAKGLLK